MLKFQVACVGVCNTMTTKLRKADHRRERESECGNELLSSCSCGAQMRIQVSALENQAGPDRTDRSPAGVNAPGGTKRGEEEGHTLPTLRLGADERLPPRPRPLELLLQRRLNGVPRGDRPFGKHKARLRPLPPILSLGALSSHYLE